MSRTIVGRETASSKGQTDGVLHSVVQETSEVVGTDFFRSLVRSLADALEVRYCFVTECLGNPASRVRTLAFWADGHFWDNFEYPLATTPCEAVLEGKGCRFDRGIQELFPEDQDLVDLEAQSYAAVPLIGSQGKAIGHLAVLDSRPFTEHPPDLALLDLFAARAASEIERLAAIKQLSASESRLRQVIDLVPHFLFAKDSDGRFILVNRAVAQALGTDVEDVLGKTDADFSATPDEVARFRNDDLEVLRLGKAKTIVEETVTDARGRVRFLKTTKIPYTTAGAPSPAVLGVAVDITEERRLQHRLHALLEGTSGAVGEAFLRSLAKHLAEALETRFAVIAEIQGDEIYARTVWDGSDFMEDLRYPVAGSPCEQVMLAADSQCFSDALQERFPECGFLAPMGAESFLGTPLRASSGEILGVLSVLDTAPIKDRTEDRDLLSIFASRAAAELQRERDEAERRRLQEQLLHVQKLESLGVLAGGIAHDFNNLLGAILGNAVLAIDVSEPDSPQLEFLRNIETAALRSAELSGQMLAYSGKGAFVVQPLDLNSLIEDLLQLLATSISKKAVIDLHLASDLAPVDGDATQIRQVIMNLITNASDALGDQPGTISLRTGVRHFDRDFLSRTFLDEIPAVGRYAFLEIRDDGCGMSVATRERLFDPFFTTKETGRGLGLAALLGIVRSHGGAVRVDSREGEGSCFTVLFPLSEGIPAAAVETRSRRLTMQSREGRVLFVDDEELIREVGRSSLESVGFQVLLAENGRQALDLFRSHQDEIVAVVLDMMMPELDGMETFRELKRLQPSVRCILSSGYSDQGVQQIFEEEGMDGFLQKPYRPEDLTSIVGQLLHA